MRLDSQVPQGKGQRASGAPRPVPSGKSARLGLGARSEGTQPLSVPTGTLTGVWCAGNHTFWGHEFQASCHRLSVVSVAGGRLLGEPGVRCWAGTGPEPWRLAGTSPEEKSHQGALRLRKGILLEIKE